MFCLSWPFPPKNTLHKGLDPQLKFISGLAPFGLSPDIHSYPYNQSSGPRVKSQRRLNAYTQRAPWTIGSKHRSMVQSSSSLWTPLRLPTAQKLAIYSAPPIQGRRYFPRTQRFHMLGNACPHVRRKTVSVSCIIVQPMDAQRNQSSPSNLTRLIQR